MASHGGPKGQRAIEAWRDLASRYPETSETGVCVNTAFKVGKKSFLFVGQKDDGYHARLKLSASLDEAEGLAAKNPEHYDVGMHGWVKVTFEMNAAPPRGLLERWIDESYRHFAPRKVVASLPESGPPK